MKSQLNPINPLKNLVSRLRVFVRIRPMMQREKLLLDKKRQS